MLELIFTNTKIFPITKKVKMKKYIVLFRTRLKDAGKYRKFKNSKIAYIFEKALVSSIICSKCDNEDESM